MIRLRLLWLKHLLYAVFMLAMLCGLTEVALRVYDSVTAQITRPDLYDRGLVCKSWYTHHALRPGHRFVVKDPDTNTPVRIAINGFGTRGGEPALPKLPGVFRVICLGDEFTFASQVPDQETFFARLQEQLQTQTRLQVEVINAGVPGYCPLLAYLQLKRGLIALQPDVLIFNFDMSDISDDYQYRRHTVMNGGLPVSCAHPRLEPPRQPQERGLRQMLLLPEFVRKHAGWLWAEQVLTERPHTIDSPEGRFAWLEEQPPDWSTYIDQALTPLALMSDLMRSLHASCIVGTYPAPWQASASSCDGEGVRERCGVARSAVFRSRRPFEILETFCRSHRIWYCDASRAFQEHERPERLYLRRAAAFSPEGHALYARELSNFVTQHVPGAWGETAPSSRAMPQVQHAMGTLNTPK